MKKLLQYICLLICSLATAGYAQNAPLSIAGTVVSFDSAVILPVYAVDFNNISSCNLKLAYDPAVAEATAVTIGQGMGGMISSNLTNPGVINFGWFTSGGISLPDSSIIFNIHFTKLANGISPVNWVDEGYSCEYNDGNFEPLNDVPAADYYFNGSLIFQSSEAPVTAIADVAVTPFTSIWIPVAVSDFSMIGSFSLSLNYNPEVMTWLTFVNVSDFPGLTVVESQQGLLQVSGLVPSGFPPVSLGDSDTLLLLGFDYLDGFGSLEWFDDGLSCSYSGAPPVYPVLNDLPMSGHYMNGSVSPNALPAQAGMISGPSGVCAGSAGIEYSVQVIPYADLYQWSVTDGMVIVSGQNTSNILVNFGPDNLTGTISVAGVNGFGSGVPSFLEVSAVTAPAAAGPVTGVQEVCQGQEGVNFFVLPIAGVTGYNWILPAGAGISGGAGTNSILVDFGLTAESGIIAVSGWNECGEGLASYPFEVVVDQLPYILTQPVSPPAVYAGSGIASFNVEAAGAGISHQWQEYVSSWTDLAESEMYSGVNTGTLTIVNPDISMNGNRYRCMVSGICEPSALTDGNATLSVLLPVGFSPGDFQQGMIIYPNPFTNQFNLSLNIPFTGRLSVTLNDPTGRVKKTLLDLDVMPGNFESGIKDQDLAPGIYLLSVVLKDEFNLMMHTTSLLCIHRSK